MFANSAIAVYGALRAKLKKNNEIHVINIDVLDTFFLFQNITLNFMSVFPRIFLKLTVRN